MTLTDIISKITQYAKKVIVNDTTGTGDALSITGTTGTGASITTTTGTALKLQQNSTNPLQGGTLEFFKSGGGDMVFDGANDGIFVFANTSTATTKATVFSGANVGINISAPTTSLDVRGDINNAVNNFVSSNLYYDGSNWKYIQNGIGGALKLADSAGLISFIIAPNNILGANAVAAPIFPMVINPSGNVGIGTISPAKTLHVNGTVRLQGLPTFANNAAAIAGGLVADDVYKTNVAGEVQLRIVI